MISKFFSVIGVICFCLLLTPAFSQNNIGIFADVKNNDSLQKFVTTFITQLKKSSSDNFVVQDVALYKGSGIYISPTTSPNQPVKPSAKLLQAGIEAFSIN